MRPVSAAVLAACLAMPAPAAAEIYRWTDAEGRQHFTQQLSDVPPEQRAEAVAASREPASDRLQTYQAPAARAPTRPTGRPLHIPFERRGNAMLVYARINDRVTAPFLVDTGASDVAIPASVAQQAGIRWDAGSPHATYQTANGLVRKPIVELGAVQVGEVRVEGLRGSISDSMSVGLLGGSFFNNFTFQVDPASQVITLVPNAGVRSGRGAEAWRREFGALRHKIAAVESYLGRGLTRARKAELEGHLRALRAQLDELERKANAAGVPQAWRE